MWNTRSHRRTVLELAGRAQNLGSNQASLSSCPLSILARPGGRLTANRAGQP